MKLYCFSDLHQGAFPVPETVPDAWLFAGDLYERPVLSELSAEDARFRQSVADWKAAHARPVYAIRGNHDCQDKAGFFRDNIDLSMGTILRMAGDTHVAGLGWSGHRHFDLPMEKHLLKRCEDVGHEWARLGRPTQLILITHFPPHYPREIPMTGPAAGWYLNCIGRLINEIRPRVVIAGHCHEHFGREYHHAETRILFPGPKGRWVEM